MAKLKVCRTCNGNVASSAKSCPHCGDIHSGSSLHSVSMALIQVGLSIWLLSAVGACVLMGL